MTQYTINLTNCAFFARHGVHHEEEVLGQRFFVDAELKINPAGALEGDELGDTVDYGDVFVEIQRIITGQRRYLIEALALEVAKALCANFPPVVHAKITIRKPNAPVPGVLDHVSVTVEHSV